MSFWTYILHCQGGVFYTGHTDDLERRMAQHVQGTFGGFASRYAPCELVWSDEFPSRIEALAAERQIKGWSRAKKLALIRGDWGAVSALAKGKSGPSTSSGRTGNVRVDPNSLRAELLGPDPGKGQPPSISSEINGALPGPGRLDKALSQASGLSRERVKTLIGGGAVTIAGKIAKTVSAKIAGGEAFAMVLPPPAPLDTVAQDIPLTVVFEDEHLIVVDKPAGLVVHPAAGNLDGTLVNALLHHCAGRLSGINGTLRPGIVHRIDKDTSGLLVVAKSDAAHEGLARQFADHSILRSYLAVCTGHPRPAQGTITGRIGRSDTNRKKMALLPDASPRGKHAVTHYRTLRQLDNAALVECRLETGRTHQVRVHLASTGHPLVGDPVYGRDSAPLRALLNELGFRRQALHAASLGFDHPVTGERLAFAADLPADMAELIDRTAH